MDIWLKRTYYALAILAILFSAVAYIMLKVENMNPVTFFTFWFISILIIFDVWFFLYTKHKQNLYKREIDNKNDEIRNEIENEIKNKMKTQLLGKINYLSSVVDVINSGLHHKEILGTDNYEIILKKDLDDFKNFKV